MRSSTTQIVSADGPSYSVEQLREAFPPVPKAKANGANSSDADPKHETGVISPHAEAIARKPDVDDRSGQFHAAVAVGRRHRNGDSMILKTCSTASERVCAEVSQRARPAA